MNKPCQAWKCERRARFQYETLDVCSKCYKTLRGRMKKEIAPVIKPEEETDDKVYQFPTLIAGDKQDPPENWLGSLKPLTIFLTAPKPRGPNTQEIAKMPLVDAYQVLYQFKRHTLLRTVYQDPGKEFPVKSLQFSRLMELEEIIEDGIDTGLD